MSFQVGDAGVLPPGLKHFDGVVSGLVLNFIPDKEEGLNQMVGAARPGGTVAAYVWDYAEGMELIRRFWDIASEVDPNAQHFDEGRRESICNPDALTALFSRALTNVRMTELVIPTVFVDFEDYWTPFLAGVGSAPSYVASLDDRSRDQLRETLKAQLPIATDGSIQLTARAWAIRGLVE